MPGQPMPNSTESTIPFRERLGCSPREACEALGIGRTFFIGSSPKGALK